MVPVVEEQHCPTMLERGGSRDSLRRELLGHVVAGNLAAHDSDSLPGWRTADEERASMSVVRDRYGFLHVWEHTVEETRRQVRKYVEVTKFAP